MTDLQIPKRLGARFNAKRVLTFTCFVLALLSSPPWVQATQLTVSYTGIGPTHLPIFIAKETGIFARNGLEVQIVRAQATVSTMALISGEVEFIQAAAPAVVLSNLGGSGAVYVAGGYTGLDYWLVGRAGMKSAEQLRGAIVGVSGLTGASFTATQFAVRKLGLNPGKDISIVAIGGTPERLAALRAGRIQATLLNPPTIFVAEKEGYKILTDVTGLPFQNNGAVTTRRFIKENPDVVRRYIKSQVEAVHIMKTDRKTGLKVFIKHLGGIKDGDILEKSYDVSVTDDKFPRNQFPSLEGIKAVMDSLGDRAKDARAGDFVDSRFVKELDDSGFVSALYKQK
jgi:ABC-type nitrate/sulfonate/bicarbonate transport system substrate-binding protein